MCGIGGMVSPTSVRVDRKDLESLKGALAHRGPDGEGLWISDRGNIGFVHRRLAILDGSERGAQPMHSADSRYTIVFNGEIYNFIELREELVALGSSFVSDSDTEVLLEAWRHWGEGMLPRLNGMWALAITDNHSGELFLSRDRFGIKPLLYTMSEQGFAFASELRALLALPQTARDLDTNTAKQILLEPFSIEAGEHTLIRAVRRLPAGHCATFHQGRLQIKRWWYTLENLPQVPTARVEQSKYFLELFLDAIHIRLRSDVPIGVSLSGGFDSSAITCAITHLYNRHVHKSRVATSWRHAFIGSFPHKSNDETQAALEVASFAGFTPHIKEINDADCLRHITEVLHDLDDVYISFPNAPWYIYREMRRAKVVVSLDGHGADELLGGYYQGGKGLTFMLRNLLVKFEKSSPLLAYTIQSAKLAYLSLKGMNFVRGHRWSAPSFYGTPFDSDKLPAHWGALNIRLYKMFHASILPTILRNFDRMSMANGIEVRMPFMDWRLVTYLMALPDSAKADKQRSKVVARDAMVDKMLESVRNDTRKVGFSSPMPEWMNGPLASWVEKLLSSDTPAFSAIVNVSELRSKVNQLTITKSWDWESAGRLWPYINLKWYIDEVINAPCQAVNHAR
jgi:asparagine synthase (glutamine-hydrolysing)